MFIKQLMVYCLNYFRPKSFNRDFKYTLGENLKNEMIDAMMYIWRANSVYDKEGHIASAREKIEKCRLYIRLLYDLRQISIEHFTKMEYCYSRDK